MRIKVLAVGKKMPGWVQAGWAEYHKRLPKEVKLALIEIAPGNRGKSSSAATAMKEEAARMLAAIEPTDTVIALDVKGRNWSTEQLAENIASWQMDGLQIALLIGGPDGIAPELLAQAKQRWSFSNLTLPHPLVRVVLVEQIYRAFSLLNNHPYHK
ncbi:23S rRNA (pseudouridine(1915)-N(3))-methyltransferase RlmH [Halioxenophilus aromaticivorans]|uniref:Ribosomal RNA large subunit methyltransferase H n=1 Tax=Halioxenophilus aromaticivorans TaxID=1306992 RepID=A0AAV3U189_9ALTE